MTNGRHARRNAGLHCTIAVLLTGCATKICTTRADEELRAKYEEMVRRLEQQEQWVAGCHDDNSMLQSAVIELQMGMIEQAGITAKLRNSCGI